MSDQQKTGAMARREFLKTAGITTGAVGAAAAALAVKPATAATAPQTGTKYAGYRETEHVRKYYETARF